MNRSHRTAIRGRKRQAGVALLLVISSVTILALVLLEFSSSARTHLQAGVNMRDEVRAVTMADTALTLTRACLDPGPGRRGRRG